MAMLSVLIGKQTHPSLHIRASTILDLPLSNSRTTLKSKDKVVFVMGATGTGKSRLSVDLATRFNGEIINSDKIQVYEGLDIAANKITEEECYGVPHHLIGVIPSHADFTCTDFCDMVSEKMDDIVARQRLPIIAGGSNNYIKALVDDEFYGFRSKYECCYLWVDVSMSVLYQALKDRVDQMVEKGMVEEVRKMFKPDADYSKGVLRAIGGAELDHYFRVEASADEKNRARLLKEALDEVKINSCILARRQVEKILALKNDEGWNIHRLDATNVFPKHSKKSRKAWEELVLRPSLEIVSQFLNNSTMMREELVMAHQNCTILTGV
ncbi:Isopentenyltransferase [Heracleum sosnowskyi]|uniref:adenylate dimethylallyltransferase (ADP/ATP-dependent) n=1 Tax=Heracleum sosnowskyi TaxID=360622 RepID=A0AAD8LYA7_9APIA|nr:Isopentenyltransferase [Heracleum sosnowskyi]